MNHTPELGTSLSVFGQLTFQPQFPEPRKQRPRATSSSIDRVQMLIGEVVSRGGDKLIF